MENQFLTHAMENTYTENGALTNNTTKSRIIDQFGKTGNYRGREITEVFEDESSLWEENPDYALKFPFYLRLVTRKTNMEQGKTSAVQKGQGQRDEAFKRLLWIAAYHEESFYKNIWLLPYIGSWKDLWTLMYYDEMYLTNVLDHKKLFDVINSGLSNPNCADLVKKFMPRIKSNGKCKTDWAFIINTDAKEFANYNNLSYKEYNHLKTSGSAHDFQKLICKGKYSEINWNMIPGRALSNLAHGKFLQKHNLEEDFTTWILNSDKAKFTGYVYELASKYQHAVQRYNVKGDIPSYEKELLDKQFNELIAKAEADGKITSNVWCALDTSGSMSMNISSMKGGTTALDICLSLGIFFSELNKGAFHNNVIMFDDISHVKQLHGTFTDKMKDITHSTTAWGGTNFQSVVDEIVRIRKENPNIPLEDYPTTLLVVSDMQFNPNRHDSTKTNYEVMKTQLEEVFPKDWVDSFKFVWWDCTSRRKNDFPATMDDGGCYFFSGYDGSIISLLLNDEVNSKKPVSMEELIDSVFNQEAFEKIKL